MTTRIYQETEKGQDEIRTCANHPDQHHRAVLLMMNSEKIYGDVLVQPQPLSMTQTVFDELERRGYTCPCSASNIAMKVVSADESAPTPAPASAILAAPSKEPTAESYQRLRRFYTETISRYLDPCGYLLEMKVEKADNIAELVVLHDTLKAALSKTRGKPETSNVTIQLGLLINETVG